MNWVQLWENGPKFAEYNVGVTDGKAESYGGYYAWGGNVDKDATYNEGSDALSGNDDTATKLWGSKWRMPTKAELEALLNSDNCTCAWTDNYEGSGITGKIFTGKGDYSDNSVFLPAAGYCYSGSVFEQASFGLYWSSTPNDSSLAYYLGFVSSGHGVADDDRNLGLSVRAVLAE